VPKIKNFSFASLQVAAVPNFIEAGWRRGRPPPPNPATPESAIRPVITIESTNVPSILFAAERL
jgi:hypothetical protein